MELALAANNWKRRTQLQRYECAAKFMLRHALASRHLIEVLKLCGESPVQELADNVMREMAVDYAETFGSIAPWVPTEEQP